MNSTRRGLPEVGGWKLVPLVLLVLLLAINGLAIATIFNARRAAEGLAQSELERRTELSARTLEAALASLRGDLLFLAHSLSLARVTESMEDPSPLVRRWSRLDAEGRILLFLQAHREVERLYVLDSQGRPLIATGRRGGAPILLPTSMYGRELPNRELLVSSSWPLGSPERPVGRIEAHFAPDELLALGAMRESDDHVVLARDDSYEVPSGQLSAKATVTGASWDPPFHWTLIRWGEESLLVSSVGDLAERYRNTVLLNLGLLALAWIVVLLALRDVRRLARAEAKARHEAGLRELESKLRQGERLASLGRMATDIAHEINNPLEGMANYLSLLEEHLRSGSTEEASALVPRVREGLSRVASIIRQVLRFGSLSAVPKEEMDLREVVVTTVDFGRASPRALGVAIEVSGSIEPLPVYGNSTALSQLVLNLFLNACEAQPRGGEVRVAWQVEDGHAVVRVADRGPGVAEEDLDRIFEPFYSKKGSSGLGLTVSHGIATEHGGSLRAENLPSGGACFTLRIPLLLRGEPNHEPHSLARSEGGRS